jgi:hypothetical protein
LCDHFKPYRAGHTIENFDDNSLILFGGSNWTLFFSSIFIFNLEKAEWREIELTGEIPEPRIWHTSSIIGLKMYIFGVCSIVLKFLF